MDSGVARGLGANVEDGERGPNSLYTFFLKIDLLISGMDILT